MTNIGLDNDLCIWLKKHHDAKLKTDSDVLRELIEFWEQCQND